MPKRDDDEIAIYRDDVIRRMVAMPPKTHKEDSPRRRRSPQPETRDVSKRGTGKKRDKA